MRRSNPFGAYFGPTLGGVRRIPIHRAFMGQPHVPQNVMACPIGEGYYELQYMDPPMAGQLVVDIGSTGPGVFNGAMTHEGVLSTAGQENIHWAEEGGCTPSGRIHPPEVKTVPPRPLPPIRSPELVPGAESSDGFCVYLITVKNPGTIVSTITEQYIIRRFHIFKVPVGTAYDLPTSETELPSKGGSFQMYELWACQPGHTPPGYEEPQGKPPVVTPPPVTPPSEPSSESAPPSGDFADVVVAGGLLAAVTALLVT